MMIIFHFGKTYLQSLALLIKSPSSLAAEMKPSMMTELTEVDLNALKTQV